MKIGVVGLGNRIAHVFHELKKINSYVDLVAYVDPQPIGKTYAIKNNFFPKKNYSTIRAEITYGRNFQMKILTVRPVHFTNT